jgi:DNA-directed RNA polymerase specialized sigma24 family protein
MMNHSMIKACAEWEKKLAATHPDDLSPSDRAALDLHVLSCPSCATVRAEYQAIDAFILDFPGARSLPDLPTWLLQPRTKPVRSSAPILTSSPTPAMAFRSMSLSVLSDRCMSEITNYGRGDASNDKYCLEIFRRAMIEGDNAAWEFLIERFHDYMLSIFHRHGQREAASRLDSPENYVARAFERFWMSTVHHQQLEFTTLAAALSYLRNCLNGAILDTLRAYSRSKEVAWPEPGFAEPLAFEDPDEGQELWHIIQSLLVNERERRVAFLLFHCNLKPREIVRHCTQEFSDVQEIYRLRRNIIERLLRDWDQIRWKMVSEL